MVGPLLALLVDVYLEEGNLGDAERVGTGGIRAGAAADGARQDAPGDGAALSERSPEVAIAEAKAALEAFERLEAARHADAAGALLRSLGAPVRTGPKGVGTLTRREAEVLQLIGAGLSNPEIGDRLYITRKTVEHHVGNILSKLGLRNRVEAAAFATRQRPARN
jgi:DNA-binding NarL/FixJ family response regulator